MPSHQRVDLSLRWFEIARGRGKAKRKEEKKNRLEKRAQVKKWQSLLTKTSEKSKDDQLPRGKARKQGKVPPRQRGVTGEEVTRLPKKKTLNRNEE